MKVSFLIIFLVIFLLTFSAILLKVKEGSDNKKQLLINFYLILLSLAVTVSEIVAYSTLCISDGFGFL